MKLPKIKHNLLALGVGLDSFTLVNEKWRKFVLFSPNILEH